MMLASDEPVEQDTSPPAPTLRCRLCSLPSETPASSYLRETLLSLFFSHVAGSISAFRFGLHCACVCAQSLSCVQLFATLLPTAPTRLLCPWNSPGKNTGVGCHFLLQGIFLTQGSNPCLLCLQPYQADSLPLAPPGRPWAPMRFPQIPFGKGICFHQFTLCYCLSSSLGVSTMCPLIPP